MKKILLVFISSLLAFGCQTAVPTNAPASKTDNQTTEIRVSAANSDAAETSIAADAESNLYVVYVEHGAGKAADVFLQKFDFALMPVGEKTRVNDQIGAATAWRGDAPTIAIAADKTIYIGWTKIVETADGKGTDLYLSVSGDSGKTFGAAVKVNDDAKPASHGMHSLAIGKNGAVYMAWLDERNLKTQAQNFAPELRDESDFQFIRAHHNTNQNQQTTKKPAPTNESIEPNSETFFAASADGGKTFSPNVKLSSEVCPCCKTSLLVAPDGRIYAGWRQVLTGDFRHIAVASSVDAGKTFSAPAIVSDDRWQINICPVSGASLAVDENNLLKVAWFTAGEAGKIGLYEAESNNFAKTFSERRLISEGEISGTPTITGNGGNSKIFWESSGKIFQSPFTANREMAKIEFLAAGNLPSAVAVSEKVFAAFIRKEKDKRAVWLAQF